MSLSANIDTGGTFTDGYFTDGERCWLAKVETTPHDFTLGFLACLAEGAKQMGYADLGGLLRRLDMIRFCTTLTTNALVQGRGTRLGLLTSRGLQSELRDMPGGLIEPELIAAIDEEGLAEHVVAATRGLLARGARALVVALPCSARDPSREREVERILDSEYRTHLLGFVPVTLSHQVSRRPEDVERATAALLNARVHALLARSLRDTQDALRDRCFIRPFLIVHCDGGCGRVEKTRALDTFASGPAAVVHGAARLHRSSRGTSIAMDIGGTTTDLAFVTGPTPRFFAKSEICGYRAGRPLPEIWSVGLGGGSIARIQAGAVTVGPASAGALPGPACFDLGGTAATVTDACLALGFFAPDGFLGGRRRLHVDLARRALAQLAPDAEPTRTAAAIKIAFEEQAVAAIRSHATGVNLSGARILALGGGGGLHAASIAEKLGLRDVDLLPFGPVFGAFGASTLDVVHVYHASLEGLGATDGNLALGTWFRELVAAARRDVEDEGFAAKDLSFELTVEHVPLDVGTAPPISRQAVAPEQHSVSFAHGSPPVMAWLRARCALPRGEGLPVMASGAGAGQKLAARRVRWGAGEREHATAVFSLDAIAAETRLPGPCLVENHLTTLAVPPGWTFTLEPNGWMHLHR
jgi:N-methylhydantoinase A